MHVTLVEQHVMHVCRTVHAVSLDPAHSDGSFAIFSILLIFLCFFLFIFLYTNNVTISKEE